MTTADRIHAIALALQSAGQGYLERSLTLCSEETLRELERVAARAHLDRQMVQDSCPLQQALRARTP
jgi:hypothetical protein